VGQAEASATQAKGLAEGKAIEARGIAEATAIASRAEALESESDAVIGQQLAGQLPEIVRAAASAFERVDNLTILNGAAGVGELMNQLIGQAGPALRLARETLATPADGPARSNGAAPPQPAPSEPPAA
jgi:flotillin